MDPFFESQEKLIRVLYQNVTNSTDIRKFILTTKLPFVLLKPKMIVDDFQLSVAITKALYNQKEDTMVTKSLQTEIIYCLSPSKNIKESLELFGSADSDTEMLIIGEEPSFHIIKDSIKGEQVDLKQIQKFTDTLTIMKMYQIRQEELAKSTLLDSVISRMASKDYVSLSFQA